MTEIDTGAGATAGETTEDERRARARQRLADAGARVTAEARIESREQVRELMGWA